MFLVKAGTVIQIQDQNHFNWVGWKPYTTKVDKIYDKEEVWDMVGVHNGRDDIPEWARRNIVEHKKTVLARDGFYAMVKPQDIEYLD